MKNKDGLSPIINILDCEDIDSIIDITYIEFKKNHMNMEIRPKKLLGKTIFIEFSNWIEHKADCYWHFISLNEKEKFNVFPCGNNLSEYICKKNCLTRKNVITRHNREIRIICPFRAARINWILDIINLANKKDQRIKIWKKDKKLHLRYNNADIDYVVIFFETKETYRLISAFPVFYINKKQIFDKDYNDYQIKKPVIAIRKPESPFTLW